MIDLLQPNVPWPAMTRSRDFTLPQPHSADYRKHHLWPRVCNWGFLFSWYQHCRGAPSWTSLTFTAWINRRCVRVKDLHATADEDASAASLLPCSRTYCWWEKHSFFLLRWHSSQHVRKLVWVIEALSCKHLPQKDRVKPHLNSCFHLKLICLGKPN